MAIEVAGAGVARVRTRLPFWSFVVKSDVAGVEETQAVVVGDQDLGVGCLDGDAGQRALRTAVLDAPRSERRSPTRRAARPRCRRSAPDGALDLGRIAADESGQLAASAAGSVTLPADGVDRRGPVPRSAKSAAPGTLPRPTIVPPLWVRSTETTLPVASAARMYGGVPA